MEPHPRDYAESGRTAAAFLELAASVSRSVYARITNWVQPTVKVSPPPQNVK